MLQIAPSFLRFEPISPPYMSRNDRSRLNYGRCKNKTVDNLLIERWNMWVESGKIRKNCKTKRNECCSLFCYKCNCFSMESISVKVIEIMLLRDHLWSFVIEFKPFCGKLLVGSSQKCDHSIISVCKIFVYGCSCGLMKAVEVCGSYCLKRWRSFAGKWRISYIFYGW